MGIGMVQNGYGVLENRMNGKRAMGRDEKEEIMDYMSFLQEKCEEILEKLRTGETEASYLIGAQSYTEREWDKLMEKFDDIQEDVRRKMEERIRKMEEKEEEKRVVEC